MITIRSYTTIEQSRKLVEFLPLESADMHYSRFGDDSYGFEWSLQASPIPKIYATFVEYVPCWSLAALLSILPYKIKLSHDVIDANGNLAYKNECYKFSINRCGLFGDKWNVQYYGKHQRQLGKRYKELYIDLLFSENYDNPVDACCEMIIRLHELNLL